MPKFIIRRIIKWLIPDVKAIGANAPAIAVIAAIVAFLDANLFDGGLCDPVRKQSGSYSNSLPPQPSNDQISGLLSKPQERLNSNG